MDPNLEAQLRMIERRHERFAVKIEGVHGGIFVNPKMRGGVQADGRDVCVQLAFPTSKDADEYVKEVHSDAQAIANGMAVDPKAINLQHNGKEISWAVRLTDERAAQVLADVFFYSHSGDTVTALGIATNYLEAN